MGLRRRLGLRRTGTKIQLTPMLLRFGDFLREGEVADIKYLCQRQALLGLRRAGKARGGHNPVSFGRHWQRDACLRRAA